MRKLTVSLGIIIFLCLFVVFGTPYIMGILIQKQYPQVLARISKSPEMTMSLVKYHRGWFKSTATLRVSVLDKWLKGNSAFTVNETIEHGPFIFAHTAKGSQFMLARALLINKSQSQDIKFNASTVWTLTNKLNSQFNANNIRIENQTHGVHLQNVTGKVNYLPNKKAVMAHVTMQQGSIKGNQNINIQFNKAESISNLRNEGIMWYGKREAKIASMLIQFGQSQPLKLNGINFNSIVKKNQDSMNVGLNYSLNKVTGQNVNLGPVQLSLAINGLNIAELTKLNKAARSMPTLAGRRPNLAQLAPLMQPMMALIGKGFSIELSKLNITTPEGQAKLKAKIVFMKQTGPANFLTVTKNISGQATLEVPGEWLVKQLAQKSAKKMSPQLQQSINPLELAKQQVAHWVKVGQLIKNGKILTLTVTYQHGQLLLNGKPLSAYPKFTPKIVMDANKSPADGWEADGEKGV